jgi:hypothetical protein
MENNNLFNDPIQRTESGFVGESAIAKSFLSNVFAYMASALAITGAIAYWFGTDMELISMLFNAEGGMNAFGYVVMFAPFGFVLLISAGFKKFSSTVLLALFLIYSLLMGLSLSTIFLIYTGSSIFTTFFITAATFAIMAVVGYTTKTDLTKFGSILMMGLIGIIIASVVNIFMGNAMMDLIISVIGVLIFTGLIAYDVQKLKRIGSGEEYGHEMTNKLAIMGALSLYLDFINLFLFMLRFLGDRK